ncbi:MAG: type II secretion system F family protein [Planctomycetaceae bacterium]
MTTILLFTFVAVLMAVIGLGTLAMDVMLRTGSEVNARLQSEFSHLDETSTRTALFKNLKQAAEDTDEPKLTLAERLDELLEQAGLNLTVRALMWVTAGCTGIFGIVAFVLSANIAVSLAAALFGAALPILFVRMARSRRRNKLTLQLTEAFELMSRAVRAGQTVAGAFQAVTDDMEAPISDEFSYCYEQQSLGLSQEVALRELARRTGVPELQMFVVALLVQRQSGGSPAELLANLSSVVRKRIEMRGKVKSLTAEGRMQAAVLLAMPPLAFVALLVLNPAYTSGLLAQPLLLAGTVASELFGALWIRKIISVEA